MSIERRNHVFMLRTVVLTLFKRKPHLPSGVITAPWKLTMVDTADPELCGQEPEFFTTYKEALLAFLENIELITEAEASIYE